MWMTMIVMSRIDSFRLDVDILSRNRRANKNNNYYYNNILLWLNGCLSILAHQKFQDRFQQACYRQITSCSSTSGSNCLFIYLSNYDVGSLVKL